MLGGALPTGSSPPIFSPTACTWFVGMSVAPVLLVLLFTRVASLTRADALLAAYNLTALAPNVYQVVVGAQSWLLDDLSQVASSTQTRLYAPTKAAEGLHSVTLAYEVWNTMAAIAIKEYRTPAFVGHHAATALLCLLGTAPCAHYYSLFFLGLCSISSVFLCLSDVFRHSEVLQTRLPSVNLGLRVGFALSFLAIRSCMWPLVSLRFLRDIVEATRAGTAHSVPALAIYGFCNLMLTGLQGLWTVKILQGLWKLIVPGTQNDGREKAKSS